MPLYNDKYKLAFECHGDIHEQPVWGKESFEKQLCRDKLKKQLCAELGVRLYIITYAKDINLVISYIQTLYDTELREYISIC